MRFPYGANYGRRSGYQPRAPFQPALVSEGERCAARFVVEGKGGQEGRIAMYIGLGGLILLIILLVILF